MTDKQQELRTLLEETIDEQVDKKVGKIQNENKELRATVNKLQDKVLTLVDERDAARNEAKDAKVLLEVAEIFKERLDNIQEKAVRPQFVYNLLINHVMLYDKSDMYEYFRCYEEEWNRRYNKPLKEKYNQEFLDFCCNSHNFKRFRCYEYWHDKTYLKICMMNLFEKYCGIGANKLSDAEWLKLCVGYKKITGEVYDV